MVKTDAVHAMDDVQSHLRPLLQEHGFRIRARTCNRVMPCGLTHVINFQMGRFDASDPNYTPGFRKNLYGKFTINVGVYVPEVATARHGSLHRGFAQEVECSVRVRLGHLSGEPSDQWWDLPADANIKSELLLRLERDAFTFLARLGTRDSLVHELQSSPEIAAIGEPPRITCAIILAHQGEFHRARALLTSQVQSTRSAKHHEYVQQIAERIKVGRIMPPDITGSQVH
jgi:hypothetical protein